MKVVETSQQTNTTQAIDPRVGQCREFVGGLLGITGCGKDGEMEFVKAHGAELIDVLQTLAVLSVEAGKKSGPYGQTFQINNEAQRERFTGAVKEIVQNAHKMKAFSGFSEFLENSSAALEALSAILEEKCNVEKPVAVGTPATAPIGELHQASMSATSTRDQEAHLCPLEKRALGITERLGIPHDIAEYFIIYERFGYSSNGVVNHNQAQVLASAVSDLRTVGLSDKNVLILLKSYPELVAQDLQPGEPGRDLWALARTIEGCLPTDEKFSDKKNQPSLSPKQLEGIGEVIRVARESPLDV